MVVAAPNGSSNSSSCSSRSRKDLSMNPSIQKRDKSVSAARSAVREKIVSAISQSQNVAQRKLSVAFTPNGTRDKENIPSITASQPATVLNQKEVVKAQEKPTKSQETVQVHI